MFDDQGRPQLELTAFKDYAEGVWSPDSKKLAILTNAGEIHVLEFMISNDTLSIKGSTLCARSESNSYLTTPSWSPDCTKLLSIKCEMDERGDNIVNSEIMCINADGSGTSQVTNTPQILEERLLMWSGEGEVYFAHRPLDSQIITISKLHIK